MIFFNIHRTRDQLLTEQKLFLLLILTEALILVFDTVMWLLDGKPGETWRAIDIAATVLYYILNPAICMVWYFYVDFQIYRDVGHMKKVLLPIAAPAAISAALSVLSVFNGTMFFLDSANTYHRGSLFFVMALAAFFYLIYSWVLTVVKRNRIPKHDFLPLAVFSFFPFIGGIVQSLFYGVSLIWTCTTIAILIIFINIQNIQLYTDHLTGLYNRRQLDRFLQNKLGTMNGSMLAGLMIDFDSFKNINDSFGHSAGDQALVDTAAILRKTFRKNDFISRFGGDEFVVVMPVLDRDDLQKAVQRLQANVAEFNTQKSAPYTISLSIGYDCYFGDPGASVKEFLKHIDELMYLNKNLSTDQ